jgi:hypothetical protein
MLLFLQARAEVIQRSLRGDPGVTCKKETRRPRQSCRTCQTRPTTTSERRTKPPPIWLNPSRRRLVLPLLKCRGLDDFPVPVAHGLAAGEHLEPLDLFGIAVKVLALDFL